MIVNTFQHIHGIGSKTELEIWSKGILSWDETCKITSSFLHEKKLVFLKEQLAESRAALQRNDFAYFIKNLPSCEHWRIYNDTHDSAAFVDIETAFSVNGEQYISTIALYDGKDIYCFIKGINLYDFLEKIHDYRVIITYSGRTFDIPFMEREFGVKIRLAHIDLRYILSEMGYKGGLKNCEKMMGFKRQESGGMNGAMAPFLWNAYENGRGIEYLHTLLAYNIEDTLSLCFLMHRVFDIKIAGTPFKDIYRLDLKPFPEIPYKRNIFKIY